ncbi:hypothetical protein An13g02170 [Aspergillus niger]|uniref:Uncharacterized protein n=2 Tax=Aspergillus niger TaxID=5061 RepID=A2R1R6_ASPNC|nr:hypothetical protein An13g02170 [Aspergillus niger]CAK41616.1 hypothetical protein An13g02170 [Aspergillus niger]
MTWPYARNRDFWPYGLDMYMEQSLEMSRVLGTAGLETSISLAASSLYQPDWDASI